MTGGQCTVEMEGTGVTHLGSPPRSSRAFGGVLRVLWAVTWPRQQPAVVVVIRYSPGHSPSLVVDVSGVWAVLMAVTWQRGRTAGSSSSSSSSSTLTPTRLGCA